MNYKLNVLGRETVRNFVWSNAKTDLWSDKYVDRYCIEAEETANSGIFKPINSTDDSVGAVGLDSIHTIHGYEVLLIMKKEHYDES